MMKPAWMFVVDDGRVIALWRNGARVAYVLCTAGGDPWPPERLGRAVKRIGYPAPGDWRALDGTPMGAAGVAALQDAFDVWAGQRAQEKTADEVKALYRAWFP